jgi:hypothetical protein
MKFLVTLAMCLLATFNISFAQAPTGKQPPVGVARDASFFNGKWYRVYPEKVKWEQATRRCAALGARLAMPKDEPTWVFLRALSKGLNLWLGATDEKTEGLWVWLDGTPMTYKAWHRRQPDNGGGREHYLHTDHNAWNDLPKEYELTGFICEWPDR